MTTSRNIDLTRDQYKKIMQLLHKYLPNTTVWAYGSRVNWSSRGNSDLDMVAFSDADQKKEVSTLREAFEESNLPFPVDFFVWDSVPEQFRHNVEASHFVLTERTKRNAPDNWRRSKWGDEVSLEYGKSLRGYREGQGAYQVYGSNGPVGWTDKYLAEGPGVILGRKGAYRGVQFSKAPFYVIDTAYYLKPKTSLDMRWLFYAVKHYRLGEIDDGSPIPSTTRSAVYVRDIDVPSKAEQKAIAHILGTLDDKIELNCQMNATLEAMAQALFKSWFVDFDPVIDNALAAGNPIPETLQAKAATRQALGDKRKLLPETIRQQFPKSFVFTEKMGWVPEGWGVSGFDTLVNLDTTSVKPFDQPDTVWEHYSIPSYDTSGMPSKDRGSEIKSNKYLVKPGAILSSKLNPERERTWWPFLMNEKAAICSTEFMQFVPHKKEQQAFVYSLIRSKPFQANILERVTGSTGSRQRAQPKLIAKIGIIDCGDSLREKYVQHVLPLLDSSRENLMQTQSLAKLRDTLLPKLLSGELRIPNAEKLVANAL